MKRIIIDKAENGYVITVTRVGNQTLIDNETHYIAKDKKELAEIVEKNA